jgi:hypothetical protein
MDSCGPGLRSSGEFSPYSFGLARYTNQDKTVWGILGCVAFTIAKKYDSTVYIHRHICHHVIGLLQDLSLRVAKISLRLLLSGKYQYFFNSVNMFSCFILRSLVTDLHTETHWVCSVVQLSKLGQAESTLDKSWL